MNLMRKPRPLRKRVSLTASQVANRQVNAALNPALASQDQYATRQNQAIQVFAKQLLGQLQPVGDQVGADYDRAIGQTAALAGGAATFLNRQNPSDQQTALLQGIGAPQAQIDQQRSMLGDVFGGGAGALMFTGGTSPGSALAAEKAGAQGFARTLPTIAALKGQQDLAGAMGQQRQARNDLLAKRPAMYQDALQNIRDNQARRASQALDAQIASATLGIKQDTIASNERIAQAKLAGRRQEIQARHGFEIQQARAKYQHDLQMAQAKYANSAKTREDEQRFQSARDAARRRFDAKQKTLDRQSRYRIAKLKGKGKGSKKGASAGSLVP